MKHLLSLAIFAFTFLFTQAQVSVNEMPQYPGGEAALIKDINSNLEYPKEAKEKKIQGTVMIEFTVETDGSINNAKVVRGVKDCPAMDEAALKSVKKLKPFTPAKENGHAVPLSMVIPVRFVID